MELFDTDIDELFRMSREVIKQPSWNTPDNIAKIVSKSWNIWSQAILNYSALPVALWTKPHCPQQTALCWIVQGSIYAQTKDDNRILLIVKHFILNSWIVSPLASNLLLQCHTPLFTITTSPKLKKILLHVKSFRSYFTVKPHHKQLALLAERVVNPTNWVLDLGHNSWKNRTVIPSVKVVPLALHWWNTEARETTVSKQAANTWVYTLYSFAHVWSSLRLCFCATYTALQSGLRWGCGKQTYKIRNTFQTANKHTKLEIQLFSLTH